MIQAPFPCVRETFWHFSPSPLRRDGLRSKQQLSRNAGDRWLFILFYLVKITPRRTHALTGAKASKREDIKNNLNQFPVHHNSLPSLLVYNIGAILYWLHSRGSYCHSVKYYQIWGPKKPVSFTRCPGKDQVRNNFAFYPPRCDVVYGLNSLSLAPAEQARSENCWGNWKSCQIASAVNRITALTQVLFRCESQKYVFLTHQNSQGNFKWPILQRSSYFRVALDGYGVIFNCLVHIFA